MSIYISYHPIDDLFAHELLSYLLSVGIIVKPLEIPNDVIAGSADIVILILRPEYISAAYYSTVVSQLEYSSILPILRSPIALADWADNEVLNPIVDFTNYQEKRSVSGFHQLASILTALNNLEIDTNISPLKLYSSKLESDTLRQLRPMHLLEKTNFINSSLAQLPIFRLLSYGTFEVFSRLEYPATSKFRLGNLDQIVKARESCLVNCGGIDTNLVAAYMVYLEQLTPLTEFQIPMLLDIRRWDKNLSSGEWLSIKTGFTQSALDSIQQNSFTIYVYGIDHLSVDPRKLYEELTQWWNHISPTLSLVMLCSHIESSSTVGALDVTKTPHISAILQILQQLCAKYSERAIASYIASSTVGIRANIDFLAQNPVLVTVLLSVSIEGDKKFPDLELKDYYKCLIKSLWDLRPGNFDDYLYLEGSIAKIAAIMTENRNAYMRYEDALNYIQSDSMLHKYIDIGLLTLESNDLRFSLTILQDYFAALALIKYGVPSHLPVISLNSQSARIPQKWDKALVLASRLASNVDKLIHRVADTDPLLALECLAISGQKNQILYAYVIDKNLESLVTIGDFRTDFAKRLYHFDPSMAQAILFETLQNGKWGVRRYAHQTLRGLNIPSKAGLVESVSYLDDETKPNVALALKRMSQDALPTLYRLLHSDDETIRSNAIWAIGEIANQASVPALVDLLDDSSANVASLAANVLAKMHDVCALPYLMRLLEHRHLHVRNAAADAIITLFDQHKEPFIRAISQLDVLLREQLVIYLSSSKFSNLNIDLLLELTRDEDVDIRIAALQALAHVKEPRVIARFKECLDDMSKSQSSKSNVSEIVSRILSNVPRGGGGRSLGDKSSAVNSSKIVKARLLSVKTQQPNHNEMTIETQNETDTEKDHYSEDGYVSDILTQLRSRKWDTSNNAAKTLRDHMKSLRGNASSKVINQVLETLNDEDWVIRWTGVESLGWVGNINVVPHLVQRLSDPNWKIRVAAIRALAEIKDNSAITGLSKLSTDSNTVVREAAAEALGFLDGKQAVVALEVFAMDAEDFVRLAAVESLGRICQQAAKSALLSALMDTSEHVRWAAANGLLGIADENMVSQLIPSLTDVGGPYWEQKRICDVIIDILKKINTEEAKKAIAEWQTKKA